MCQNYQNWLRRFNDKSKNVRWPRFFGPQCYIMSKQLLLLSFNRATDLSHSRRHLAVSFVIFFSHSIWSKCFCNISSVGCRSGVCLHVQTWLSTFWKTRRTATNRRWNSLTTKVGRCCTLPRSPTTDRSLLTYWTSTTRPNHPSGIIRSATRPRTIFLSEETARMCWCAINKLLTL